MYSDSYNECFNYATYHIVQIKALQGKILTNGPSMEFDEQNFDKSTVIFIGKVIV